MATKNTMGLDKTATVAEIAPQESVSPNTIDDAKAIAAQAAIQNEKTEYNQWKDEKIDELKGQLSQQDAWDMNIADESQNTIPDGFLPADNFSTAMHTTKKNDWRKKFWTLNPLTKTSKSNNAFWTDIKAKWKKFWTFNKLR
jgi:hypothetical protein